jgi:hypothetical protein
MLDMFHTPSATQADIQRFIGTNTSSGTQQFQTWVKPRGKSMAHIFLVGSGGNGGAGAIGANSTAAGGGGGGSGPQSSLIIPLHFLPSTLSIMLMAGGVQSGVNSYICFEPSTASGPASNQVVLIAQSANNGGNAAGATAGTAGAAGANSLVGSCCLSGLGTYFSVGGQAGMIGGVAVAGTSLILPTTGLIVTGGTGGGGLPAAAATGTNGGSFTVPVAPASFPPSSGGIGSATGTAPAQSGNHGIAGFNGLLFNYGGTGGASTHGTATGAGLVQSSGGNGAPGCGGGGTGGALTGSTAGVVGKGGPAFCIITCW